MKWSATWRATGILHHDAGHGLSFSHSLGKLPGGAHAPVRPAGSGAAPRRQRGRCRLGAHGVPVVGDYIRAAGTCSARPVRSAQARA